MPCGSPAATRTNGRRCWSAAGARSASASGTRRAGTCTTWWVWATRPGPAAASSRPNRLLAAGGLPLALLEGEQARRAVDAVEARLLTPLGPRTLAPGSPGYAPRCVGGVRERDGAYHQGTVWPWLIGPFVDAWVRVRGGTAQARREAGTRFLGPPLKHLHPPPIR